MPIPFGCSLYIPSSQNSVIYSHLLCEIFTDGIDCSGICSRVEDRVQSPLGIGLSVSAPFHLAVHTNRGPGHVFCPRIDMKLSLRSDPSRILLPFKYLRCCQLKFLTWIKLSHKDLPLLPICSMRSAINI